MPSGGIQLGTHEEGTVKERLEPRVFSVVFFLSFPSLFIPQLSIIHHMLSTRNRQTVEHTACCQVGYNLSSRFVDSIFANSLN